MPYIDKAYMITRFGEADIIELTDRVEPITEAIVDDVLDAALISASGIADAYISARYKTPLSSVPEMIKDCVGAIAYYKLCRDRYTDEVRQEYDDALKFLKDVANGKAQLVAEGSEPDAPIADAQVIAPDRIFSRDSLKGF